MCVYVAYIYIYIYIVIGIRILCCSVFDFKLNGLKYLVKKKKQKKCIQICCIYTSSMYVSSRIILGCGGGSGTRGNVLGNVLCGAQPHLERFSFDNNRRLSIVVCVCVCR